MAKTESGCQQNGRDPQTQHAVIQSLRVQVQLLHQTYRRELNEKDTELESLREEVNRQRQDLEVIYRSRSWRLTTPLRLFSAWVRALRRLVVAIVSFFWRLAPVSLNNRIKLREAMFRRFPRFFRATPSFESWQAQRELMQDGGLPWDKFAQGIGQEAVKPGEGRIECALPANPIVSVIIPVYNQLDYTLRCLDSMARCPENASFEVLVVDDASADDTFKVLGERGDLRYFRNASNLGFVGSCNRGASEAHGRYLFFLNNDTTVLPGWLDELLATFARMPDAGLVGSRLVYPDGRLQEAGGIIWSDGSGWNWGKFKDRLAPEFNFLRDVDYCSGAAIMVPRDLFEEVGGFSLNYAPAYYEDTDLAFRIRAVGRRVLYQPLSWVIHHEGITAGTDISTGTKAYQERNRGRFVESWAQVLANHGTADSRPVSLSADRRPRARLLLMDHCTPTPDQDSGSLDLVNYLKLFDEFGYRVTFVPESDRLHLGRYTEELQARGVECLYGPYLRSITELLSHRGSEFDAVMLMRGPLASRYVDEVRKRCPHARIIFNTVDLHFLRERRRAELETGEPLSQAALEAESEELHATGMADATIVISPVEKELLQAEVPGANIHVIPIIREIPGRTNGFNARSGVVFIGGFRHHPNVDGILWFCNEIWPLFRAQLSAVRLTIIGSHLPREVARLQAEEIDVLGYVEELGPVYERTRLSLAPLRYGAGQKGKVVGSLSYGVPCIATEIAAEGLWAADEEGVLVANQPQEFADAMVRGYTDAALWEKLSDSGLSLVEREFSLEANKHRLGRLLTGLELPA